MCGDARWPLPSPRAVGLSPPSDYIFGAKSCGDSGIESLDALDCMLVDLTLICPAFEDLQIR